MSNVKCGDCPHYKRTKHEPPNDDESICTITERFVYPGLECTARDVYVSQCYRVAMITLTGSALVTSCKELMNGLKPNSIEDAAAEKINNTRRELFNLIYINGGDDE